MKSRFTYKKAQSAAPQKRRVAPKQRVDAVKNDATAVSDEKPVTEEAIENKTEEKNEDMLTTSQKVEAFEQVMSQQPKSTAKKIKNDKGLIEKVESTRTVLTEDNRELLRD